jgi:flagellar hook-length control protein FliK
MNAAHGAGTANTAAALAAQRATQQAAQAGADASAALPDQTAALASIQAAPLAASPDAPGSSSAARVGTPLGHPQWAEDFSRQVLILSSGDLRNQSVKLHVTPPELGPLHIALNISNNVAHAVFASAHAEVRNAVENALPQLQQALAQNGLALGQANVGDQQQFAQQFHDSADRKPRGSGFTLEVAAPATSMAADPAPRLAAGNSLVDTFA